MSVMALTVVQNAEMKCPNHANSATQTSRSLGLQKLTEFLSNFLINPATRRRAKVQARGKAWNIFMPWIAGRYCQHQSDPKFEL
jgi:hypothetical protein